MSRVNIFPEFIQLFDDDIVSLTALTVMLDPNCRVYSEYVSFTQLTLSLYLMTQCQLKLRHSATSLAQTIRCIKFTHKRHPVRSTLERLLLKMIAHKSQSCIEQKRWTTQCYGADIGVVSEWYGGAQLYACPTFWNGSTILLIFRVIEKNDKENATS